MTQTRNQTEQAQPYESVRCARVSTARAPSTRRHRAAVPVALAALAAPLAAGTPAHAQAPAARPAPVLSVLDQPIAQSWHVSRAWDAQTEREYSQFVSVIGHAAAARRCHTLSGCLSDPAVNPLAVPGARPLHFRADCADVPYVLRAYFAFRRDLPFAWSARIRSGAHGRHHDVRYMTEVHPDGVRTWQSYHTARELIENIGSEVHSGFFRMAPDVEASDSYPTRVDARAIRPGTAYYDPNGHVLVVYEVRPDGTILLFDGHPDNTLTHRQFSEHLAVGGARQGGGFRNFRPYTLAPDGTVTFAPNAALRDFDPVAQAEHARHRVAGQQVSYHDWVRAQMSTGHAFSALH